MNAKWNAVKGSRKYEEALQEFPQGFTIAGRSLLVNRAERRLAMIARVCKLKLQFMPLKQIAQECGLHIGTVVRYVREGRKLATVKNAMPARHYKRGGLTHAQKLARQATEVARYKAINGI